MDKWIHWHGKSTDGNKRWNAQAESYKDLYIAISEKYGYGEIVEDSDYERAVLEANGEAEDKFGTGQTFDAEAFDLWYTRPHVRDLNEAEYKSLIENSQSNAYYHDFEVEA